MMVETGIALDFLPAAYVPSSCLLDVWLRVDMTLGETTIQSAKAAAAAAAHLMPPPPNQYTHTHRWMEETDRLPFMELLFNVLFDPRTCFHEPLLVRVRKCCLAREK
jgi:hypothetical protein